MRRSAALLLLAAASCKTLEREPDPAAGALVEPEVFDVIRAANSKAAVEELRHRYEEEVRHARLLEARIGEQIAAEEALGQELRERSRALQEIRDRVRELADAQAAAARALAQAQQETAALEAALAAERARQDELHKQAPEAAPAAPAPAAKGDG